MGHLVRLQTRFLFYLVIKKLIFDLSTERSSRAMAAINAGMESWRTKTCVTFKKRTSENAHAYIHIGEG